MIADKIKNGFKNGASVLFQQQQQSILSGASVIGGMVLISAVLGLVRKRLYAGILAAGPEYDVLVAAFRIPDLIFQLLVVGTLNAAFIPLFSRYIVEDKGEKAWRFAASVLNLTFVFFLFSAILGYIFSPQLTSLLVPGFSAQQQEQVVSLMRIILLSPILLGVSSFVGGIIQSFRRFFLPFFSPIAYNLGGIFGILFLYLPLGMEGMAWGVVIGAFLHLVVQLPLLRTLGFRYRLSISWTDGSIRELLRLALPRTLWSVVFQIREVIVVNLASLLSSGAISVFDYGLSIVRFPILVFGSSISQASLPALSESAAQRDFDQFKDIFINSFLQILYLIMPISVILIVLKIPVVRLIFGTGNFSWRDTVLTSWILALFGISLFSQAGKELIVRGFYALKDTDTPVLVGVGSLVVGLVLGAVLMPYWSIMGFSLGLFLGLSLGFILEFFVLLTLFMKVAKISLYDLIIPSAKIAFSAAVMAVAVYAPVHILDQVFIDTTKVVNLLVLVWVVLTFGGSVYLFLTWILGCEEIRLFLMVLLKIRSWREALVSMKKWPVSVFSYEGEEMDGLE